MSGSRSAKVEPARQRSFEEAKAGVETALRAERLQKALAAKADALAAELRAGKPIEDVAKTAGAEVEHANEVKRAPQSAARQRRHRRDLRHADAWRRLRRGRGRPAGVLRQECDDADL